MKRITFTLLLFSFNCAIAQHTWTSSILYLKSGDTLMGQSKIPLDNKTVPKVFKIGKKTVLKFRKNKKSKKKKYAPKLIDSVIFNVKYPSLENYRVMKYRKEKFIPVKLDGKKYVFVAVLIEGKTTLLGKPVLESERNTFPTNHGTTLNTGNGVVINVPPQYGYTGRKYNELYLLKNDIVFDVYKTFSSFKKRAKVFFNDCSSLVDKIDKKEFRRKDIFKIVDYYNTKCSK